jgi:hypothetical protein
MLPGKALKNFADTARFGEHLPDFGRDLIEVKIRARTHAQDNGAAIDVGRRQFVVADQDAFDCETQGPDSTAARGSQLTSVRSDSVKFYCSLRADIGKAISNAKPSFVAGGDGGRGSARAALVSLWDTALVSAPIATFVTFGGSQVLLSSIWQVLIGPIADFRAIEPIRYGIGSGVARQVGLLLIVG